MTIDMLVGLATGAIFGSGLTALFFVWLGRPYREDQYDDDERNMMR